jgi:hypothetical protein
MVKLTPRKTEQIAEKILYKDENYGYQRFVSANYKQIKITSWSFKTDESLIIVITSKLYNTPPYQRDKKQITIDSDSPNNVSKLKAWAKKIKYY